ncbi:SPARC-related modular calcium-binding protein 1-like isoform X1 [Saccoglossus kowalevskii]|uniref:SPARC-related modular calcium-binding protein 1-like isoform X2 n=1 Tax=Saccoglossus kowalevskii TaxID=10224 RepID=A0ABM0M417_SACKO|nr:PREDICTED: SPARC-related modular calcium-binding protein 1-like isoform X2 [Saccoglossus kowalevskii]
MRYLWLYISCVTIAGVIANPLFGSRFPIGNDDDRSDECNEDCSTVVQRAVCGSDGRTYGSRCELMRARCRGSTAEIQHKGVCQESSRCEAERKYNQEQANQGRQAGLFIPECTEEGSFREVQCYASTGYCWCVTDQGKPIPGSSVRYQQPHCNADDSRPNSRQGKSAHRNKGCSQSERQVFNNNLISIFKDEYARLPTKPPAANDEEYEGNPSLQALSAIDEHVDSVNQNVIDWKFSELDTNADSELDKKELKTITKMIKKIVEPRTCARNFAKYCDLDQDGSITNGEWAVCLGVDNKGVITEPQPVPSEIPPEIEEPETKPERISDEPTLVDRQTPQVPLIPIKEHSCQIDRQVALAEAETAPDADIFIPECTSDGKFRAAQCHAATQYCWCVLVDTGRPIPGTSTQYEMPECGTSNTPKVPDRDMKGCPTDKKERFLTSLFDKLTTDMVENMNAQEGATEPDPNDSLKESTAKWKFRQLDLNGNDLIDRKESAKFKKEIKSLKPKKCARSFSRYCDADEDRKITLTEWLDCYGLNKDEETTTSSKRRGPNPFIERLT